MPQFSLKIIVILSITMGLFQSLAQGTSVGEFTLANRAIIRGLSSGDDDTHQDAHFFQTNDGRSLWITRRFQRTDGKLYLSCYDISVPDAPVLLSDIQVNDIWGNPNSYQLIDDLSILSQDGRTYLAVLARNIYVPGPNPGNDIILYDLTYLAAPVKLGVIAETASSDAYIQLVSVGNRLQALYSADGKVRMYRITGTSPFKASAPAEFDIPPLSSHKMQLQSVGDRTMVTFQTSSGRVLSQGTLKDVSGHILDITDPDVPYLATLLEKPEFPKDTVNPNQYLPRVFTSEGKVYALYRRGMTNIPKYSQASWCSLYDISDLRHPKQRICPTIDNTRQSISASVPVESQNATTYLQYISDFTLINQQPFFMVTDVRANPSKLKLYDFWHYFLHKTETPAARVFEIPIQPSSNLLSEEVGKFFQIAGKSVLLTFSGEMANLYDLSAPSKPILLAQTKIPDGMSDTRSPMIGFQDANGNYFIGKIMSAAGENVFWIMQLYKSGQ